MTLSSVEDAQEYVKKVEKTLLYLTELAKDAGLYTHAGMFCGISAAFYSGADEIEILSECVHGYIEDALSRLHGVNP